MQSNPDRDTLVSIISSAPVPENFRVVLDVDRTTENLRLRVLKVKPWEVRFWGHVIYRSKPNWDNPEAEQRCISGRTYAVVLQQLLASPEFLEFEVVVSGGLHYREATISI